MRTTWWSTAKGAEAALDSRPTKCKARISHFKCDITPSISRYSAQARSESIAAGELIVRHNEHHV